jgi:hypothetical protein
MPTKLLKREPNYRHLIGRKETLIKPVGSHFQHRKLFLSHKQKGNSLVVEETCALLNEDNTELLSSLKDGTIVLATTGSSNILDT